MKIIIICNQIIKIISLIIITKEYKKVPKQYNMGYLQKISNRKQDIMINKIFRKMIIDTKEKEITLYNTNNRMSTTNKKRVK